MESNNLLLGNGHHTKRSGSTALRVMLRWTSITRIERKLIEEGTKGTKGEDQHLQGNNPGYVLVIWMFSDPG